MNEASPGVRHFKYLKGGNEKIEVVYDQPRKQPDQAQNLSSRSALEQYSSHEYLNRSTSGYQNQSQDKKRNLPSLNPSVRSQSHLGIMQSKNNLSRASLDTDMKSRGTIHCTADQATIVKMMVLKKGDPVLKNIKENNYKTGKYSQNDSILSSSIDVN